jgi:glucan phosphoethanolaminetransferase (alkaline phosphatase superfamily)
MGWTQDAGSEVGLSDVVNPAWCRPVRPPAFIYVDKFGVHFPYSDKYPPDFHALPTPLEPDTLWSGGAIGERALAHYPNVIAWSVDEFFRRLLPAVDLSKTLIVYTSDHGQNMLPGHSTHCSTTPMVPPGEEAVPLFAITSVPEFEQNLERCGTWLWSV